MTRRLGLSVCPPTIRNGISPDVESQATSEPARTRKNVPPESGQASDSDSSVYPAAASSRAAVAHTWNGDGEASMNSHRLWGVAGIFSS